MQLESDDDVLHHWLALAGAQGDYFRITDPSPSAPIPIETVWKLLWPAIPDVLRHIGGAVYEAKWWPPVPAMDVEILRFTEGISIIGKPFTPPDLPKGCAVLFVVTHLAPDEPPPDLV